MKIDSVGVIGGGAWGTALAQTLRLAGRDVLIWARESETVDDINERHVNRVFLPGVELAPGVRATTNLRDLASSDVLLLVAPAQHVRGVCTELRPHLKADQLVVMCAKGIEQASGKLMGEVLNEALPDALQGVLSGPSFAADVARGLPTALTIACRSCR